jgi:predicted O-methyltransferase YrrM
MRLETLRHSLAVALCGLVVFAASFANAQTPGQTPGTTSSTRSRADCERVYKPATGQAGKDVIWVPTNDALVERMLRMAKTTASDLVYDLGAGDGKIAIAAAKKFGATSVGVEYNADMATFAQCLVKAEGVSDKARVIQGDIFETDFTAATVVTLYLLPELNLKLRRRCSR